MSEDNETKEAGMGSHDNPCHSALCTFKRLHARFAQHFGHCDLSHFFCFCALPMASLHTTSHVLELATPIARAAV